MTHPVAAESDQPDAPVTPAVVILAGGAGTRFWPASTRVRPKQLLPLLGSRSLLQESFDRALSLAPPQRILVLTNTVLVGPTREQLPELPPENVVAEPVRRDTAAAVCLATLLVRRLFGDAVMVVLAADHHIEPPSEFVRVILSACRGAAASDALYTVGIPPRDPATGYGYLETGEEVLVDDGITHRVVRSFREKPDRESAVEYLRSGGYAWNSGMFVWRAEVALRAFAQHLPGHLEALEAAVEAFGTEAFDDALAGAFADLPTVSVDYGIMEKVGGVRAVEATFRWDDVGSWTVLGGFLPDDGEGNRHRGVVASHDATDNVTYTEDPDEVIALVGVSDLVVVRAGHLTLVAAKERAEEIKELVRSLERAGTETCL